VSNDAAVLVMGDEVLKKIAMELVVAVQSSATIDWSLKESVRAATRSKIRRLLAKYYYPPDYEERAVELILAQAEQFATIVPV
jgi:type I restriction enzyme R subunit